MRLHQTKRLPCTAKETINKILKKSFPTLFSYKVGKLFAPSIGEGVNIPNIPRIHTVQQQTNNSKIGKNLEISLNDYPVLSKLLKNGFHIYLLKLLLNTFIFGRVFGVLFKSTDLSAQSSTNTIMIQKLYTGDSMV